MSRVDQDANSDTWSREADGYSGHFNWNDAGERVVIHRVADDVRGGRILDVGVGTGRTSWLVSLLSRDYTGVDYTPAMVGRAREICPWADIRLGDARDLDFPDASFDFVFFSNAGIDSLGHDDRADALREFARVLRPGGWLVYSTLNRDGPFFKCGPGPVVDPGRRFASPNRIGRFAARVALRPGEHLHGFRNVHGNRARFEDHRSWALDTMPTHAWSLIVHYITTSGALQEVVDAGFAEARLFGRDGHDIPAGDPAVTAEWFYVSARRPSQQPTV